MKKQEEIIEFSFFGIYENINLLIVFLRISLFLYFETLRKKEDVIIVYYINNLNLEKNSE